MGFWELYAILFGISFGSFFALRGLIRWFNRKAVVDTELDGSYTLPTPTLETKQAATTYYVLLALIVLLMIYVCI